MKRILTIVGARPQFIKAAAISHVVRDEYENELQEDILHTGQHYDDNMSGTFFRELDIPAPRYNLGVGSGTHGAQTAAMLKGIEEILLTKHYDAVLVYGDTNTTLAGALAAAKINVPVMHVEAGLRSFNRTMPEEINRVVTDHVSYRLFAPTQTAVNNLKKEGFSDSKIVFSGDVMLDNTRNYSNKAKVDPQWPERFILATVHRDFNTDNEDRLRNILAGLCSAAEEHQCEILFPAHPRTRHRLDSMNAMSDFKGIHLIEPLSYLETLGALLRCKMVATDSGGLQKEAYFSGRPCVLLRPETEWTEIVDAGMAMLANANTEHIVDSIRGMWNLEPKVPSEFGDGHAAGCIVQTILETT